jgi:hypothetical protein
MFPVGYTTVDSEAPEDQPWRQSAYPQGFQEYFDTVCNDIVTLKSAPMNKTPHNGYDRIVYGEHKEGQVIYRKGKHSSCSTHERSERSCSSNMIGLKLSKERPTSMLCAGITRLKSIYDIRTDASTRGFVVVRLY